MGSFISHAMSTPSLPPIMEDSSFADLPQEILISILKRLRLVDRIRFGSVCSSFLSAFRDRHCLSASPLSVPWIFLPEESTDTKMAFFSIAESKIYKIPQSGSPRTHLCLGSSDGWLVIVEQVSNLAFLLNPITRSQIHLPAPATPDSSAKLVYLKFCKAIVSWKEEEEEYTIVLLSAWQSSTWRSTTVFLRQGDKAWTPFGTRDIYADAAFRDGQFYTLQSNGTVEAWDLAAGPTPLMKVVMPQPMPSCPMKYLVSSEGGDILQVCRSWDYAEIEFKIFKLDLTKEEWVEMERLEDQVLFLNSCCSMSLSSSRLEEFKFGANCIFFDRYTSGKNRETVVFKMRDKSVEKILCHGSFWKPSSIWIAPRLM